MVCLYSYYGFQFAGVGAGAAFDAFALVDDVNLFPATGDGLNRADF